MIKRDLILEFSRRTGKFQSESEDYLEEYLRIIQDFLIDGDGKVIIKNFGTFEKRKVKERRRINPNNKQIVIVPEYYKVVFRVSKKFFERSTYGSE